MPSLEHLPDHLLPLACVFSILVVFVFPMWGYITISERRAAKQRDKAIAAGRNEPVTIQPYVDQSICMGSGACVTACPETVLGLVDGQAVSVNMSACIGHGACVTACPVGAIELLFGSEKRGIDIPRVGPNFESNVPGLFIAGELGGMGLIAHAAEQGVKALEGAAAGLSRKPDVFDVAIVGAGPAGLGAAAAAIKRGLSYVLLEQDDFGGAVRHYPRKKLVFTRSMEIPGYGRVNLKTLHKEELVELFRDIIARLGIAVSAGERVDAVSRASSGFTLKTTKRTISAQRVILALGRRGTPRKLDVPGEEQEKVAYSLLEPEHYQHDHLMVVGGGDSAVEAALQLAEQPGNKVSLSYRGEAINRPKEKNIARLEKAVDKGEISLYLQSEVRRIEADRIHLERNGESLVLPNDHVFVMVGGVLPTKFLESAGIAIDKHYGKHIEEASSKRPPKAQGEERPRKEAPRKREEPTIRLEDQGPIDEVPFGPMDLPLTGEPTAERLPSQGSTEPTLWLGEAKGPPTVEFPPSGEPPELLEPPTAEESFDTDLAPAARRLPSGSERIEPLYVALGAAKRARDLDRVESTELALATCLILVGRDADARRLLGGDLEHKRDPLARSYLLARLDTREGRPEAASSWELLRVRAEGIGSAPDLALALAGQAELARVAGSIRAAKERLTLAAGQIDARTPIDVASVIETQRVELELALGRWNEARAIARAFSDRCPRTDAEMLAQSRSLLAAVHAEGGSFETKSLAREAIEAALRAGRPASGAIRRAVRALCDLGADLPEASGAIPPPATDPIEDATSEWLALQARTWARADRSRAQQLAKQALSQRARCPISAFRIRLDVAIALRDAGNVSAAAGAAEEARRGLADLDMALPGLQRGLAKLSRLTGAERQALRS